MYSGNYIPNLFIYNDWFGENNQVLLNAFFNSRYQHYIIFVNRKLDTFKYTH